ncbi:MAG: prolipoprotein diacylglyceryl transferase [Isosphaeraceae bacterium]
MAPILFRIPLNLPYFGHVDLPIYGFGMMLVLAFIFSPWLAWWRARKEGLDGDVVLDMGFWVFVAGLVGARTFYCIEYWGRDIHSLLDAFQYWKGGIVYYGGIVGGTFGFFVYRWFYPFPLRPYLDTLAPSIALGTFFGRLGCFLNGCCYGDQCALPWAVSFPAKSAAWWHQLNAGLIAEGARVSLPVHPTQLYSAIDGLVLLVLLSAFYPMRRRDGEVMGVLMLAYPITRFLIEYIRNDEGAFYAGLTISQNISIGLFFAGLAYWAWMLSTPRGVLKADAAKRSPGRTELAAARS